MNARSLWWRIAWRNLWRNKRRTVITAAALAFGYLSCVLMIGLWYGIIEEMMETGTNLVSGQVQVHAADYLPKRGMHATIGGREGVDVGALLRDVEAADAVVAAAPRVYAGGLVSSGEQTVAGIFMGVDPEREAVVTRMLSGVIEGRLPTPGSRELLVGDEMAETLEAGVGDEIVVVAPAADGSLGNDLFTLAGIMHSGLPMLDGSYVVMPMGDLQTLIALDPGRIHEVAMSVTEAWGATGVARALEASLTPSLTEPVSVRSWTEFRAELAEYARLAFAANGIVVAIVFGMAIFGVASTMLMSTFERRREFAMVRAIGTRPSGVGRTVLYEGLILGIVSLVVGVLITAPVMYYMHEYPLDLSRFYSGFTMAGAALRPVLRVEYTVDGPVASAVGLLVTSLVAALYPAYRAVRVPPADILAD